MRAPPPCTGRRTRPACATSPKRAWLRRATERLSLPLLRVMLPEVVDYDLPVEGVFHNMAIVAIDKQYPFHGRKVMHALWGMGQLMFTKCVVVVDQDVDVHDPA